MMDNEHLKQLTDTEFGQVLDEMRQRGYAVAAYGVAELVEGPLHPDRGASIPTPRQVKAWLVDHRDFLEDVMCDAVWSYARGTTF